MTPGLVVVVLVVAAAAAASVREEAVPETGEYLPEDTFRKLAAVLYRRGDKVPSADITLTLFLNH